MSTLEAEQKIKMIRDSLIHNIYTHYHQLINTLKNLPLPPQLPGIQYALLSIDSGMLWYEKMLMTAPLVIENPSDAVSKPEIIEEKKES